MALTPEQLYALQQASAPTSGGVRSSYVPRQPGHSVGGFIGNLGGGVHDALVGILTSPYYLYKAGRHDLTQSGPSQLGAMGSGIVKGMTDYYSPLVHGNFGKFGENVYQNPFQVGLDVATLATGGGAAIGKAAGALAKGSEAGSIAARIAGKELVADTGGLSPAAAAYRGYERINNGPNAGMYLKPATRALGNKGGEAITHINLPRNPVTRARTNLKEHLFEKMSQDHVRAPAGLKDYFHPDTRGARILGDRLSRIAKREAMAATSIAEHAAVKLSKPERAALFYRSIGFQHAKELIGQREQALADTKASLAAEKDPHVRAIHQRNVIHLEQDLKNLGNEDIARLIEKSTPAMDNAEAHLRVAHDLTQEHRRLRNPNESVASQRERAIQPLETAGVSSEQIAQRNPMIVTMSENRKLRGQSRKSSKMRTVPEGYGSDITSTGVGFQHALYTPDVRRITDQLRQELTHKGGARNVAELTRLMVDFDPQKHSAGVADGSLTMIKQADAEAATKTLENMGSTILDKLGPWAHGRSKADIEDMLKGIDGVVKDLSGQAPKVIPTRILDELTTQVSEAQGLIAQLLSTPVQLWRSFVLSIKGTFYVNNFVGNMLLGMVAHGAFKFPKEVLLAGRKGSEMGGKIEAALPDISRTGYAREVSQKDLAAATGLKHPINSFNAIADFVANKMAPSTEDVFRRASASLVAKEVAKRLEKNTGMKRSEAISAVLNDADAVDYIFQKASGNMLDYSALTPFERNKLRPLFPFWSFTRAMFGRTVRLVLDEPWKIEAMGQMSSEVVRENEKTLGGTLPPYMTGLALTGGKDKNGLPRAVSTYGANPFSAVADTAAQIASIWSNDPKVAEANPLASLNPYIKSALDAHYKKDTFTGQPLAGTQAQIYAKQLALNFPLYASYHKYKNPSTSPALERGFKDTVSSYLGLSQGSVNMENIRRNQAIAEYMLAKSKQSEVRSKQRHEAAAVAAGRR